MCMDTSPNGTQVAWGNHLGEVFVSSFSCNADEEPDLRTIQGRVKAKRGKYLILHQTLKSNKIISIDNEARLGTPSGNATAAATFVST